VFPGRYGLNSYILLRRNSVFMVAKTDRPVSKRLSTERLQYVTAVTLVSAYCREQAGRESGRLANSQPEGDEPCLTDGPA
jgi:hypothetical protein